MWNNHSYNNEEYYREDRERDRAQRWSQAPMESFGNNAFYQSPPYSEYQEDEGYVWNHQYHYEPPNEEMSYGWNHDYQYEQTEYGWNPQYQHEPSIEEMEYEWSNEHQYYPSNEEMDYMEECGYQPDSAPSQDDDLKQMIKQVLDEQRSLKKQFDGVMAHLKEHDNQIAFHLMRLNAKGEVEEVSDEDMVQESEVLNDPSEEYDSFDEHQEEGVIQDTESNEDVLNVQDLFKEETDEIPENEDMTPEGEVMDVFPTDYEMVVECQDDPVFAQQQSPAGEEMTEIIQLHENTLDEDALASMIAVMNEKTLRYNNASANKTNKEEDEVFQLYELPQKELHHDEAVGQEVPGSPTPRSDYPQGTRKKLEWRIKHKWKEKLRNV